MSITRMYRAILGSAMIFSPAVVLAQDPIVPTQPQAMPNAAASSPGGLPHDGSPSPGATVQEMQDKRFMHDIAQGNLAEVKLGQLATTKASSDDVKELGARMVADHTQMSRELAPLADNMGVRLPKDLSKPDQAEFDKLSRLSGDEFDKAYISMMLENHRKDLRALRQEAMSTNDDSLRTEVDKSAMTIRGHMGMVIKLAREKGIAVPPPPQRAGATPPPPPSN